MHSDINAPAVEPPPRQVEPWTRVPGHEVIGRPGRVPFCSCGERSDEAAGTTAEAVSTWRTEHLRNAWPVLVERGAGETLESWRSRISDAYVAASKDEHDVAQAAGMLDPVRPGGEYPLMTNDYHARATVSKCCSISSTLSTRSLQSIQVSVPNECQARSATTRLPMAAPLGLGSRAVCETCMRQSGLQRRRFPDEPHDDRRATTSNRPRRLHFPY
jgi:hypothetical protein